MPLLNRESLQELVFDLEGRIEELEAKIIYQESLIRENATVIAELYQKVMGQS